jgi:hypothetical protein
MEQLIGVREWLDKLEEKVGLPRLRGLFGSFGDIRWKHKADHRQVSSRKPLLTSTPPNECADIHFPACLSTATRRCGSKVLRGLLSGGDSSAYVRVHAASCKRTSENSTSTHSGE